MSAAWPTGLVTPLVTPLADDALDREALRLLLERQVEAGAGGVVVGGGTGEHGALSLAERRELAEAVADVLAGRIPFVVQTGALATRDCVALTEHAERIGAVGSLVASPYGEPISWPERRRFYQDLDAATELPIMLYNTPPAGILTVEQVEELAALPHVSAIKDSSGDVTLHGDLLARGPDLGLAVYVGADSLFPYAIANGARGVLIGTGNLIPGELVTAIRSCTSGDGSFDGLWPTLRAFLRFMEESSNYAAMCKAGLALDGLDVGAVRPPYLMPGREEEQELADRLKLVQETFAGAKHAALGA